MSKVIDYPIIFLNYATCDISATKKNGMVADIRMLHDKQNIKKYQENVIIVDVRGNVFTQVKKRQTSGVNLWLSLIYAGRIVRVEPEVKEEVGSMSLLELKAAVFEIIKKKPKKWLPLGPPKVIKDFLDEAQTYKDVMRIFNSKI